jgi:hypothetical protein
LRITIGETYAHYEKKYYFKIWFFQIKGFNACQRVRVWLVALARSKLVKENEPEENP